MKMIDVNENLQKKDELGGSANGIFQGLPGARHCSYRDLINSHATSGQTGTFVLQRKLRTTDIK